MQRISINMSDNTKIYGSGKNAMCPNCSWQDIGTALYNGSNEMRPICSWSFYNGTTHFGRQESLAPRSATSSGKKKKLCSMMRYISYILEFDWYQYTYIHIYICRHTSYRVSQENDKKKTNPIQKWVLWGKIFLWTWLRSAWSCVVLVRNDPKTFFQTKGSFSPCTVVPAVFYHSIFLGHIYHDLLGHLDNLPHRKGLQGGARVQGRVQLLYLRM